MLGRLTIAGVLITRADRTLVSKQIESEVEPTLDLWFTSGLYQDQSNSAKLTHAELR